jgi:glycosyltransferase involved in cell wall biosynthesis
MKVLLVSEPGVDGVFRHVERLCHFLIERDHTVLLAYSTRRGSDRLYQLLNELESRRFPTLDLKVENAPGPGDLPALVELWRFQNKHQADVIHGHSSKAGFLVRTLRLLGVNAPLLYTPHAYYRMNDPHNSKARFFHLCERLLGKIGDTVNIGESESAFARRTLGISSSRQFMIRNGVDCSRFVPPDLETKRKLRAELGFPENAKVLGSVGRCSAQKDPLTMYRAVHQAHEKHPDLYFLHVGQGEFAAEVDTYSETHGMGSWCKRLPYLPDPNSFYKMLDGFILSSLYEGMSYATLEAIATGLPLILARSPGNEDFDHFGLSHVFLGEPRDPTSLSAAIDRWFSSLDAPSNHRELALSRFDEALCFDELLEAYRKCIASR